MYHSSAPLIVVSVMKDAKMGTNNGPIFIHALLSVCYANVGRPQVFT